MADTGGVSAGDTGGVIAGVVVVGAAIGKGIRWLLNWRDARAATRSAKLQRWHEELERREAKIEQRDREYQAHIETELRQLKIENRALRAAFEMVATPLRSVEPGHPALARAQELLTRAFPLDPSLPEDMGVLMSMIDMKE